MLRDAESGAKQACGNNAVLTNSHTKSDAGGARDDATGARDASAAGGLGPDSSASPYASWRLSGRRFCCDTPDVRLFSC